MSEVSMGPSARAQGPCMLTIALRNDRRELSRLADHLEQFRQRCGLSTEDSLNVSVILDELINNIISYAYADAGPHEINVAVRLERGLLRISVEDDGRPFNPLDAPPPNLDLPIEQRPIGGLGIFLVRSMADSLDYRRDSGRNVVTLEKKVHRTCVMDPTPTTPSPAPNGAVDLDETTCPRCGESHDLAKVKGCVKCLKCGFKFDCNGW